MAADIQPIGFHKAFYSCNKFDSPDAADWPANNINVKLYRSGNKDRLDFELTVTSAYVNSVGTYDCFLKIETNPAANNFTVG